MSEAFTTSGESSDITAGPAPQLQGLFIPGIDNSQFVDGFGMVTPWGGGSTTRRYGDYGISAEVSQQSTQLNDLATGFIPGGATYNLEGFVGPQGPVGPPGPPGLPGIGLTSLPFGYVLPINSNYFVELPHNIDEINDLGTAADKLVYTSESNTFYGFVWEKTSIDASVKSWNDSDSNTDGSFLIIAADAGVYVSTDNGDSWAKYTPDSDDFIRTSCAASNGRAVVLGDTNREDGTIWTTVDYGANWVEKTVGAE